MNLRIGHRQTCNLRSASRCHCTALPQRDIALPYRHSCNQQDFLSTRQENHWLPSGVGNHPRPEQPQQHQPLLQQHHQKHHQKQYHHHQEQQQQQHWNAGCQAEHSVGRQRPWQGLAGRATGLAAGILLALGAGWLPAAHAHIPLDSPTTLRLPPPEANMGVPPGSYRRGGSTIVMDAGFGGDRSSAAAAAAAAAAPSTASRAKDAISQLELAHAAVRDGHFDQALNEYQYVVSNYGDLALSSYARTGRALLLYQVGQTSAALLALEEQEVVMRGTAEVHAALAALMWVERPSLAFRAEQMWEVAREFDTRYSDPSWVAEAKHWPPKAVDALSRFLTLQR